MKYERFEELTRKIQQARNVRSTLFDLTTKRLQFLEDFEQNFQNEDDTTSNSAFRTRTSTINSNTAQEAYSGLCEIAQFYLHSGYSTGIRDLAMSTITEQNDSYQEYFDSRLGQAISHSSVILKATNVSDLSDEELSKSYDYLWKRSRLTSLEHSLEARVQRIAREAFTEILDEYVIVDRPEHIENPDTFPIVLNVPKEYIGISLGFENIDLSSKKCVSEIYRQLETASMKYQEVCGAYTQDDVDTLRETLVSLQEMQREVKKYREIAQSFTVPPIIPGLLEDTSEFEQFSDSLSAKIEALNTQTEETKRYLQQEFGVLYCNLHESVSPFDLEYNPSVVQFVTGTVEGDCRTTGDARFFQGYIVDNAVKYFQEHIASSL